MRRLLQNSRYSFIADLVAAEKYRFNDTLFIEIFPLQAKLVT
jgi:hypothetical protein